MPRARFESRPGQTFFRGVLITFFFGYNESFIFSRLVLAPKLKNSAEIFALFEVWLRDDVTKWFSALSGFELRSIKLMKLSYFAPLLILNVICRSQ